MEVSNEVLLNAICELQNSVFKIYSKMKINFPDYSIAFDTSSYSVDRSAFPESPIGLSWEISIEELDNEFFTFEITNEAKKWILDGFVSKPVTLDVIESFVTIEEGKLIDLLEQKDFALNLFSEKSNEYLRKCS